MQHAYFSSFDQSHSHFVALLFLLPSSMTGSLSNHGDKSVKNLYNYMYYTTRAI